MAQNLVKNISGNVASSYQVNLAIGIPNITENYINSHVFTCRHWVSTILIKIYVTLLESFLIGQISLYSEGFGANRNVTGKLGIKLVIISGYCPPTRVSLADR